MVVCVLACLRRDAACALGRCPSLLIWLLAVVALLGGARPALAGEPVAIVLTGDPSPDGNGSFLSLDFPSLNAKGEVAFGARLTGTQGGSTDQYGVYLADTESLTQRLRSGAASPDGNGVFEYFGQNSGQKIALNDNRDLMFFAEIDGSSGGYLDAIGIFGIGSGGTKKYARYEDSAPDANGVFEEPLLSAGLDNAGSVSFWGKLAETVGAANNPADDHGVFRGDGSTLAQLVRAADLDWPELDDIVDRIGSGISSNRAGQVAIHVTLGFEHEPEPYAEGEPFEPPPDLDRIFVQTGETIDEIFRSGTATPDALGVITRVLDDTGLMLSDDGSVVFTGLVDADDFRKSGPRIFLTDGQTLRQVVRQNELAPNEAQFQFEYFVGLDVNRHDEVAFSATLYRNAVPPNNQTSGIFLSKPGSALLTLLREDDPAPNGNGTFGDLNVPIFMNNRGEILFATALNATASPATDRYGIFFIHSDGAVETVARSGQPLAGSTITFPSFLGSWQDTERALAGFSPINDAGQVSYLAGLLDGRGGIFLQNVPEPGRATLALSALATLLLLRRRHSMAR